MTRSNKKLLLASIGMVALLAGGILVYRHGPEGMAMAQGQMPAMPVPYVLAEQKPVQIWKDFSGRLTAVDYVEIRPQVSGILEKINFEDGQTVKKGDVLFNIDPRPYEAAVASARAELASAQQDSVYAQKELERAELLLKTGAISQAGYDARVNSQKNNKSAIAAANAHLKAAMVDLDHAAIKAPIDGRISRPEITEGNLVTAALIASSTTPLMTTIVSDAEIYADFEVDEQTYLNFVRAKTGQDLTIEQEVPVELKLAQDDKTYTGKIKSFDNRINPSTGTIRVRALFANEDKALLPGMFATVRLGSIGKDNAMMIPEKAIMTDQSRKFVYVVADGIATYREVKPGDNVGMDRIILSGLEPGDKVIVDNLMKLRPGAPVQAMTEQELAAMKAQMAAQAQGGQPAAEEKAPSAEKQAETPKEEAPQSSPPDTVADEPATMDSPQEDAPEATPAPAPAQQE